MPFNGSGVFVRLENWSSDAASNLPISATKFDIEDNDFAGGFDLCLTRDGQGAPSSPLTWAQLLTLTRGSDGEVFGLARTAGANNPALQFNVADVGGFTLNTSIATGIALAIAGTAALSIASTRAVTITAPSTGSNGLTVQGISGSSSTSEFSATRTSSTANNVALGPNINLLDSGGASNTLIQQSGGQTEIWQFNGGVWHQLAFWTSARNMTINAPAGGNGVQINGLSASLALGLGSTGAAGSLGLGWSVGVASNQWNIYTTGSDPLTLGTQGSAALSFATNDVGRMTFAANGSAIQGYGPVAAALVDMTPDTSSWTATLSGGFTSNPSGTIKWRRNGGIVHVWCDSAIVGTSNAVTDISVSGLPAAITPSSTRYVPCHGLENNTGVDYAGRVAVNSGGTLTISLGATLNAGVNYGAGSLNGWANAGSKGITAGWSITYGL
jgi:hypothetical protein